MEFDILLMIVFGVFGVILRTYRYPTAAFMLAIILGPLLEANFLRATRIGGVESLLASPISKVIAAVIALSLLAPLLQAVLRRRAENAKG
jgi:putative tricarboxylic transport membrane protein